MKLFKYITIAFSSLFMCGCSDYLDNAPDDTLTMEMVFNDRTRTEDWLSGCLLYTSPSPRDISGSRMPSSA